VEMARDGQGPLAALGPCGEAPRHCFQSVLCVAVCVVSRFLSMMFFVLGSVVIPPPVVFFNEFYFPGFVQ